MFDPLNFQAAKNISGPLSWYEEGTWTPTVTMGSSQGTAAVAILGGDGTAKFTRTGRVVFISAFLRFTKGTGTGAVTFGGLPYVAANTFSALSAISDAGITTPASTSAPCSYVSPGLATIASEFQSITGAGSTTVQATHCSANWDVIITGSYVV